MDDEEEGKFQENGKKWLFAIYYSEKITAKKSNYKSYGSSFVYGLPLRVPLG